MIITCKFEFGQLVNVDGGDIIGRVTGVSITGEHSATNVEVGWFHAGVYYSVWFMEWRLEAI